MSRRDFRKVEVTSTSLARNAESIDEALSHPTRLFLLPEEESRLLFQTFIHPSVNQLSPSTDKYFATWPAPRPSQVDL